MQGQLLPAQQCYRAVLDKDPNQPDALHLMGLIAMEAKLTSAAIQMLKRAVGRKPADPALRGSYADALMEDGDPVAAERQLRRALKLSPEDQELRCKLARCLAMLGQEESADRIFQAVLACDPRHRTALLAYAGFLVQVGKFDLAETLYRKAIDTGIDPAAALVGLAGCRKFHAAPPELADIRRLLEQPGLKAPEAIKLCRAAAKICNDIEEYDEAFQYYVSSKKIIGPTPLKPDYAGRYRALRSFFTSEFFTARTSYGDRSEKPVFIVGMPRSGTTLTEQIIASHPKAAAAGEIGSIRKIAVSLGFEAADSGEFARRVAALKPREATTLARECLSMLSRFSSRAARVTDKLPHNFEVLGLAALLLPEAKIIHCRRSPLDTCVSCYLTPLKEAHAYAQDLTALGEYYREYSALMEHWRQVLPTPILEVSYEALVTEPEKEARRLLDFIGLDWDPACLDFQAGGRAVRTISVAEVRRPIYRTSIERWRRYEKFLGPLRAALADPAY